MTANDMWIVGNLTSDPEIRYVQSGAAVVNLTVADTPRSFNRETNQWEDSKDTLYLRCTMWREMAENVANTLKQGMEVIVIGRLVSRSWESNGEKRTANELQVEHIGPSLRWMTGQMTKAARGGGQQNNPAQNQRPAQSQNQGQAQNQSQAPASQPPASDEPPF